MTLDPILAAPLPIQIHATAASTAMLLGGTMLLLEKGTRLHKAIGRVYVALMLVVATSALFINEIRMVGPFSPIHLFVLLTYTAIVMALWNIRRGRVEAHRAWMVSLYFGALFLTGAFTLLPGRRMHDVLFGAGSGWAPAAVAIPLAILSAAILWRRMMPGPAHKSLTRA